MSSMVDSSNNATCMANVITYSIQWRWIQLL